MASVIKNCPPLTRKKTTNKKKQLETELFITNLLSLAFQRKALIAATGEEHSIECSVAGTMLMFMIDSGSPVNTISVKAWQKLLANKAKLFEVKTVCDRKFFGYGSKTPLRVLKQFRAKLVINEQKPSTVAEFYVIEGATRSLLGKPTAEQVKVLKVGLEVHAIKEEVVNAKFQTFPKAPGVKIKFEIDHTITPKRTAYFRVPIAMEDLVDRKLEELLQKDIIEYVTKPAEWISPLVVVPKGADDVRICVDMRNPNKAIKRMHHPMPVIEDFLPRLRGARIFSRIDITSAYHHLELDSESRKLTTFMARRGLMRYKRLPFGINCAPEVFQSFMEEVLLRIKGCMVMLDDIIVYGRNQNEHDERVNEVKSRLRQNNLTLNDKKCLYCVPELEFLGFHISATGIKPAKSKIVAIENFRRPESSAEVSSFLGLVNFVGSFIANLSTKTEPLRKVANGTFVWQDEQQQTFDLLRTELIRNTRELGYFDRKSPTVLYTDASPVGLGAVLIQLQEKSDGKRISRIIAFASKALTDTEKRYSQTQREALALVWAVERFYIYLFG